MFALRSAADRGHANHGWLDSYHSFSFGSYYDPKHLGFSNLRVINDDTVAPGGGFGRHGHRDMEIISYVLDGALEHRDSMGNGSTIRPGDVQLMSAGSGVEHSEYNASSREPVHFLQIWLQPNRIGVAPRYDQRHFPLAERRGRFVPLVTPDGRDGSLMAHQDGLLFGAVLTPGERLRHGLAAGRRAYVQVARGSVDIDGQRLDSGDGLAVEDVTMLSFSGIETAEILLFDLP
jgi:redox-sensitive bicupin YhaK (pirin superfamily)